MAVNKKWVADIPGYYGAFLDIDFANIVNDIDTFALARV